MQAYIGLGSNLEQPALQIKTAMIALNKLPGTQLLAQSSLYSSKPLGPQDQPDFVNAVALIQTELAPLDLLNSLQAIEQQHGRIRKRHWGERTLDLDILLFGDLTFQDERLVIPHKELTHRDFVLKPMLEITPELCLPDGTALSGFLVTCTDNQLSILSS
ncbi:MAG: 2-amino-4-hydroxy-6-hydroxymethyldihydropteridine diphosphokinase [Hahellaceae bacterium]|nr:2-amino-4-hydroxy-6-hydroxymethyldihydropteridine diphosphokinase [Hahellaceae bacterium]MCP5168494.1 2-amino-4-hydroxy-6-hydroxymethyldihydropteridine diphosphokinase [Hahellaceae bacterium]